MAKFKAGDRVQVANDVPYILEANQRKGTVKSLVMASDGSTMYMVQLDNYAVGYEEEDNYLAFKDVQMKHTSK